MRSNARLVVDPDDPTIADLYLPREKWEELIRIVGDCKLTVSLRFTNNFEGGE